MSEEVRGQLRALITRGIKGDLHCILIFTSQRIIVAVQSMLFQIAGGLGAAGAVGAVAGQAAMKQQDVQNRASQMSLDEILKSNKRNFEVPYADIAKVQMDKKLGTSRLYIQTQSQTHKFKFQFVKFEQVEQSVRKLLPSSVMVETGQLD